MSRSHTGGAPVPLQNRVTPAGDIVSVEARGMMLGNRGCIHDPDHTLGVTRWRTKMWIACVLRWRTVRRDVMPPGRWTALFFLDEATALSAGHRPCGYCRRDDHVAFGEAWRVGHGLTKRLKASEMDVQLHAERVESRTRRKRTFAAVTGDLPDGAMVLHQDQPALLIDGSLLPWSFDGYGTPVVVPGNTAVDVLTPPAMVAALGAGYRPMVHPSAGETPLRRFEPATVAGWSDSPPRVGR